MAELVQQSAYDLLLAEAIRLKTRHERQAKHFVPKMYAALVNDEGLTPQDAADRIYKDLVGIWEKDTIRRLLPVEAKNQSARDRQALSRLRMKRAGLILQTQDPSGKSLRELEQKNARLAKLVETLQGEKKALLEKTLRLERMLSQRRDRHKQKATGKETTVVMPPHLFMKAFTLMRSSTKPLVLKVSADEVVDIDKVILNE